MEPFYNSVYIFHILLFSLHYQITLGYLLGIQKTLRWTKKKCGTGVHSLGLQFSPIFVLVLNSRRI